MPPTTAKRPARRFIFDSLEPRVVCSASPRPSAQIATIAAAKTLRDLPYGQTDWQQLDLYLPKGAPPEGGWPVVVAIHGGGWRKFDKSGYGREAAALLTKQGFAVVAPNYTLASPGNPSWPKAIDDLDSALNWIAANAQRHHLDTRRVATMGASAGANLALLLAYRDPAPDAIAIRAVVASSAPTDLVALQAQSPRARIAVIGFLGGPPVSELLDDYRNASPVALVNPNDPPTLLVHGASDSLVPKSQSVQLAAVLKANRVPTKLVLLSGQGHELPLSNPTLAQLTAGFLRRRLAPQPEIRV
jgi:acetyl esterase/lipase